MLGVLRDLASVAFIFVYAAAVAYGAELAARRFVFSSKAYAEVCEAVPKFKRMHASLSAASERATAAGKVRDAAKLARDLEGLSGELKQAKMMGTGLAGRASILRNMLPWASMLLLCAAFPSDVALTLPWPVPQSLAWATHRGVEGDDARAVGVFFVWLAASAVATRVVVSALLPPIDESAEFSVAAVLADAMAAVPAPKSD